MGTTYEEFDDTDYVARARAGDRRAGDALAHQYYGLVYSVALARLNYDRERAEELTQEVFLRAFLHLSKLSRPAWFPRWLVQITRNLAGDWQRRDQTRSALVQAVSLDSVEVETRPHPAMDPRAAAGESENREMVRITLLQLRPDDRDLLLLHYVEELSQARIAHNLGLHPSTVMRRIDAARVQFERIWNREGIMSMRMNAATSAGKKRTAAVVIAALSLTPTARAALALSAPTAVSVAWLFPGWLSKSEYPAWRTVAVLAGCLLFISVITQVGLEIGRQSTRPSDMSSDSSSVRVSQIKSASDSTRTVPRASVRGTYGPRANAILPASGQPGLTTTSSQIRQNHRSRIMEAIPQLNQAIASSQLSGSIQTEEGDPVTTGEVVLSWIHASGGIHPQPVQGLAKLSFEPDGTFSTDRVSTGVGVLSASIPGYVRILEKVTIPGPPVRLVLKKVGAQMSGTVRLLKTGQPVPGATIEAAPMLSVDFPSGLGEMHSFQLAGGSFITATSDGSGRFSMDQLPAAEYILGAWNENYVPVPVTGESRIANLVLGDRESTTVEDLYVWEGFTVSGKVTNAVTGEPLDGVRISESGYQIGLKRNKVTTSTAEGTYHLSGVSGSPVVMSKVKATTLRIQGAKQGFRNDMGFLFPMGSAVNMNQLEYEINLKLNPSDQPPEQKLW